MPFGLSNAPSVFQRFMNKVFSDLLDICMVIYLDDILIYSDDLESHKNHVTVKGAKEGLAATSKMRKVAVAVPNRVLKVQGGE